jgi:hypothetical protein
MEKLIACFGYFFYRHFRFKYYGTCRISLLQICTRYSLQPQGKLCTMILERD